jgi:serine/threonine protein kinase
VNTTRAASPVAPDTRAHLLDAVREASAARYETLGELGPSARSVMAYLAREKSDRALSILLLERDPMSPIGEDRYTIAEANELDDRVPTLGITCDACQAPLATWAARCGVCGGEVVGTPDDPAVVRRLAQVYSALLGSMPRPGGGSIYFARQGDGLVALRLMTTGETAEPFKLAATPVDPTRAPMLPTPPAAPRTPDMTGATRRSKPTVSVATGTTRVCAQCGAEYPADQRFCPTDGSPLRSKTGGTGIIGEIIAERYHVVKALGEGGMGQVYLAEQVKMRRMCALKVMRPQLAHDPDAVRRFGAEAENASRIAHPNVAAIYDFGETPEGLVYLAMEFVDGPSLASMLARERVMPPGRVATIGKQVADALSAAHELGIVHRDLKPDNVMIVRAKDGTERVKVVDFGIAKAMADGRTQMTRTGFVLGTPAYMSPEQISGDKLDGRSDLYSLGCMLFEMLTGQSPFSGPTGEIVLHRRLTEEAAKVRTLSPDCPKNLDSVITRLLSRRVDDRFQHAAEVSETLDECIDEDDRRGTRPKTPIHSKATIVMNKAGATTVVHATKRAATTKRKAQAKAQPNYLLWGGIAAAVVIAVGGVIAWRTLSKPVPAPTTVAQAPAPSASQSQSLPSQSSPSQSAATQGPSATDSTPDTQAAATPPKASVAPSTPSKSAPKKQPAKEKPTPTHSAPVVATTPLPAPSQPAPQPQQQVVQQPAPITPPAVTPPPAAAPVVDLAAEVGHANQVVKDYVYALNDKNINRMKQLYPTMPGALESGLRALTANATDFSALMTTPPNASVLGDAGDTEFAYQLTFSTPAQGKSSPSFRYHAALAKQGGLWQIKSLTLLR